MTSKTAIIVYYISKYKTVKKKTKNIRYFACIEISTGSHNSVSCIKRPIPEVQRKKYSCGSLCGKYTEYESRSSCECSQ